MFFTSHSFLFLCVWGCGVPPVFFFCFFLYIFFLFRCFWDGFMRAKEYIDSHGGLGVLRGCFFFGVCGGFPPVCGLVSPWCHLSSGCLMRAARSPHHSFFSCHSFF